MKCLLTADLSHVSGGISDEVFLASLAVGTFVLLAAAVASNPRNHVVTYDYTYYDDTAWGWYLMPYSYYPTGFGYYGGYYW